jgi:hypothetical protein
MGETWFNNPERASFWNWRCRLGCLADAFDLESGLFDSKTADPYPIADQLWIHEVNIQKEIKRNWHRIWILET